MKHSPQILFTALAAIALMLAGSPVVRAADISSPVFQDGEELTYKVKFGFVRLGTVTVTTKRDQSKEGVPEYHLVMKLESNPSVPFFRLNEYNESVMDPATLMSKRFYGLHTGPGKRSEVQFHYEPEQRRAYFTRKDLNTNTMVEDLTIDSASAYTEGPTLFFYGRVFSASRQIKKVMTMVDGKIMESVLDFTKGRAYINVDAAEHVRTRKYEGTTGDNASSVGVSGGFTIWVSDDSAAVPIRAEMQISVGSVTLELEKWRRANWQPPS